MPSLYYCRGKLMLRHVAGLTSIRNCMKCRKQFPAGAEEIGAEEDVYSNRFNPTTKEENIFILAVDIICCFCCSKT